MNTFDWVLCILAAGWLVGWLVLRWLLSDKDSWR